MDDSESGAEKKKKGKKTPVKQESAGNQDLKTMTLVELNTLLNDVLEKEDYLHAIAIRDEINTRKKKR